MLKHSFSDFSYAVNNDSAKKNNKEILVCFMYNGTEVLKKVYIPEKAGTAYIFEAKKIIDQEMRNGELAAYAHKFVSKHKKKEASSTSKSSKTVASTKNDAPKASKPKKGKGPLIALIALSVLLVAAIVIVVILLLRPAGSDKVAVTFDAGEGSWNTEHAQTISVNKGTKWSAISKPKENPTSNLGSFVEWTIDNKKVEDSYVFNKNTSVFASYNKEITLTFNSEPGYWEDDASQGVRKINVNAGSKWQDIKNDSRLQVVPEDESIQKWTGGFTIGKDGEPLENYYTFTNESVSKTFVASFEDIETTMVKITIDPGEGTIGPSGQPHDATIVSVDTSTSPTLKQELDKLTINPPVGHVADPTWEYCNSTTDTWENVEDASEFVITEATNFRATFAPKTDISITINPRYQATGPGGQWTTGEDKTSDRTFYNITYDTTLGQLITSEGGNIAISANTGYRFDGFAIGEGESEEVLGNSYVITGDEGTLHATYANEADSANITLNAGTGTIDGKSSIDIYIPLGKTWGDVKGSYYTPVPSVASDQFIKYTYGTPATDVTDATVIDSSFKGVTFTANYGEIPATDFATDPWAVIKREADKGLDSFLDAYDEFTSLQDIIGAQRTVELFGNTYNVSVIGTDADTLTGGNTATLTFEFQEVVTCGVPYIDFADTAGEYASSNIRSYLNDTLYEALPDDLQSVIGETTKTTFEFSSTSTKTTQDKLFPLSLTEMGYTTVPLGVIQDEGDAYAAYVGTELDTPHIKYKADGITAAAYWNRSPYATTHEGAAWGIYSDGILGNPNGEFPREGFEMISGLGVSPAFTVGSHS